MKKHLCTLVAILIISGTYAQGTSWKGVIQRPDKNTVVFNFSLVKKNTKRPSIIISNASEKIVVNDVRFVNDSVFINMPVFESSLRAKVLKTGWEGVWEKGTSSVTQVLPFAAIPSNERFDTTNGPAKFNITGRWSVSFEGDKAPNSSLGEFTQVGNKLTGTFLTPSGDYRYQEGIVTGDKMILSGFDGSHAFLFTADIVDNNTLKNGVYYSGAKGKEAFTAIRNDKATVFTEEVAMALKPGEHSLNFSFPDLTGKKISIKDDQFKNKVVIIQIMGSWCPNCMDETAFLSDFYKSNKDKGVAIIGLAYEYSTDFSRSVKSLNKFKDKFNIKYPILVTGIKVSDPLRTEKTLPQVTPIKVFPSTIFIDKKGMVRKFDTGFFGPGTGEHYDDFKKEFTATVQQLLKE